MIHHHIQVRTLPLISSVKDAMPSISVFPGYIQMTDAPFTRDKSLFGVLRLQSRTDYGLYAERK